MKISAQDADSLAPSASRAWPHPIVRWLELSGVLVGIAAVVLMPFVLPNSASLFKATTIAMWMAMGIAWNWVAGFAGRMDLAFGAYFAIGAYTTAYLMAAQSWDVVAAVAAGSILAALLSVIVGASFLRLRGMSYAIATLCVYLAVQEIPVLLPLVGAGAGLSIPTLVGQSALWYAFGAFALLGSVATFFIRRSQFGLSLLAAREDELSADARGVNIAASQVAIYVAMGAVMGLVGGTWSLLNGFVSPPTVFTSSVLLFVLVLVLVGGVGTVLGPVVGAIVFIEAGDFLWNRFLDYHDFILSICLMALAYFAPHGLSKRTFEGLAARLRPGRVPDDAGTRGNES
ncbi:MAG: branched-chain amino acid ABC transporter permease [Caldimonas sp.]